MRCTTASTRLRAGRPAILYKSLPSLILPAGDGDGDGRGQPAAMEPAVAADSTTEGPGAAAIIIPLKETLARRLSASMDCIDAAGTKVGDKQTDVDDAAAAAAADAANTTTSESQLGVDVDEPQTQRP